MGKISIHAPRTGSDGVGGRKLHHLPHFNPRSPHGERPPTCGTSCLCSPFQSTLPARGATPRSFSTSEGVGISIHAPRTGSDARSGMYHAPQWKFQSTLPARGATSATHQPPEDGDFNPRSPHGERHQRPHQPPEDGDFNPRSPHGERRGRDNSRRGRHAFQSTLPARGATPAAAPAAGGRRFQSTLPARGATAASSACHSDKENFNPRSPHGERPPAAAPAAGEAGISIHAPRTGSDSHQRPHQPPEDGDFNPRSPHGERPIPSATRAFGTSRFQSTLPARGATRASTICARRRAHFNPRSPHGERPAVFTSTSASYNFNPRSPHGERRHFLARAIRAVTISIHAPRTGSDTPFVFWRCERVSFQSTLPARGATRSDGKGITTFKFQSTLPARGATPKERRLHRRAGNFNPRSPHGERPQP